MNFNWFRRQRREADLDAEIRSHFDEAIRDRVERGETPDEARANALRKFGNMALVKEVTREMWGWASLERLGQDLRFGLRMSRKNPGFTLTAVLTLALGIGANTAIFSVVNAVLLRPLPYAQPERIVAIWDGRGQPSSTQSATLPRNFQLWREQSRSFSDLALARGLSYRLTETPEVTTGVGQEVTPNLFALLGVSALRGRPLVAGDETAGDGLVVLSYKLWQSGFGGDESLVGRTMRTCSWRVRSRVRARSPFAQPWERLGAVCLGKS